MTIPMMSSRFFMCPSSVNGTLPSVRPAPVYTGAYMWIERALLNARCGDTAAAELLTGIRPSRLTRAGVALEPVVRVDSARLEPSLATVRRPAHSILVRSRQICADRNTFCHSRCALDLPQSASPVLDRMPLF
jgi:hypothetical protein